jgi:hypothetical protein
MRIVVAVMVGLFGLPTLSVGDAYAQSSTILEKLRGADPQDYLVGPTQGRRKPDDIQNLSAPPSNAPTAADAVGRSREITPSERQELLQNRTRETPLDYTTGRDRN